MNTKLSNAVVVIESDTSDKEGEEGEEEEEPNPELERVISTGKLV